MSQPATSAADELAINQLVARYCDAVARRDSVACGATFASDAEWDLLGMHAKGRDAIVELWSGLVGSINWVVQVPAFGLVDVTGDVGRGRWYVTEYSHADDGTVGMLIGVYEDDYCKEQGTWAFAHRQFHMMYMGSPDMSGTFQPFSRPSLESRNGLSG